MDRVLQHKESITQGNESIAQGNESITRGDKNSDPRLFICRQGPAYHKSSRVERSRRRICFDTNVGGVATVGYKKVEVDFSLTWVLYSV